MPLNQLPLLAIHLVNNRLAIAHVAAFQMSDQVATVVDARSKAALPIRSAGEAQCNHIGIGTGSHDEVVLQLLLIPVENEIDTGINAGVTNFFEVRHVGPPLGGVVPNKVAAGAIQWIGGCNACGRVRPYDSHVQNGLTPHCTLPARSTWWVVAN